MIIAIKSNYVQLVHQKNLYADLCRTFLIKKLFSICFPSFVATNTIAVNKKIVKNAQLHQYRHPQAYFQPLNQHQTVLYYYLHQNNVNKIQAYMSHVLQYHYTFFFFYFNNKVSLGFS
jgi:hypothetical protein